jgi:tRNA-(ms[2]io[6]A)-hydroxylase
VAAAPDDILAVPTTAAWVNDALAHWPEVLLDHANCEKKAASTALALMFAYPEDRALSVALARLAREELRHFEQVVRALSAAGIPFRRQQPGRYAQQLRAALRTADPARKLDLLLMGALIEARSAERFGLLAPHPPAPPGGCTRTCTRRRGTSRCTSAPARAAAATEWPAPGRAAAREAQLVTTPRTLRFHSGSGAARRRGAERHKLGPAGGTAPTGLSVVCCPVDPHYQGQRNTDE